MVRPLQSVGLRCERNIRPPENLRVSGASERVLTRLAYSVSATVTSRCADRAPSERPRGERGLCRGRVILDAIDRLPTQPGLLGNACDAYRIMTEHVADHCELLACVARLAAEILGVVFALRVDDSGLLSGLRGFGLRACAVAAMNAISASRTAFCMGSSWRRLSRDLSSPPQPRKHPADLCRIPNALSRRRGNTAIVESRSDAPQRLYPGRL
jgi:hypothetical protein